MGNISIVNINGIIYGVPIYHGQGNRIDWMLCQLWKIFLGVIYWLLIFLYGCWLAKIMCLVRCLFWYILLGFLSFLQDNFQTRFFTWWALTRIRNMGLYSGLNIGNMLTIPVNTPLLRNLLKGRWWILLVLHHHLDLFKDWPG